ncbi:MAG: ParA family protein [Firmicutes bacterium]|nr:ParA family protein [Bacillota bacterium]
MAHTIVLTNQKGGVGKTTTSAALIAGLAKKQKRVLAIDMDPQGNLGFSFGMDIENKKTLFEVFKGETNIYDAIQRKNGIDLISSNILLSGAGQIMKGENRELTLKKLLEPVERFYDYIVIDTPPSFNILTLNGYSASDYLIIPMSAEILSLVGLTQIKETYEAIRRSVNPDLKVMGIVMTKFDGRRGLSWEVKEMAESVAEQMKTRVFDTAIRSSVAVAEAPAHGESVIEYAPRSNAARDYKAFVEEVLKIAEGGQDGEEN